MEQEDWCICGQVLVWVPAGPPWRETQLLVDCQLTVNVAVMEPEDGLKSCKAKVGHVAILVCGSQLGLVRYCRVASIAQATNKDVDVVVDHLK